MRVRVEVSHYCCTRNVEGKKGERLLGDGVQAANLNEIFMRF